MPEAIPIHDFTRDDHESIPFRFVPLNASSVYNTTEPHRHNYYEIFFFTKGGGYHTIDFEKMPIADNSIHFVSPGQVHLLQRADESFGYIILFSREFYYLGDESKTSLFNFPFLNNGASPTFVADAAAYAQFMNLLDLLQAELAGKSPGHKEILRSYTNVILLKCAQLSEHKNKPANSHQRNDTLFNELRKLVERSYRTERQPAVYASELAITEKKLNELCKAHCGQSVGDYIKSRVLLEAKRLLSNSDHSVKEIAWFLGFEDPSYFNRFFKINTGVTAGDFRKTGN